MSACVQVFGCRHAETIRTLGQPASSNPPALSSQLASGLSALAPRSGLERSDFVLWHFTSFQYATGPGRGRGVADMVGPSAGPTRSGTTRLGHLHSS
jgi:hypothetical protein